MSESQEPPPVPPGSKVVRVHVHNALLAQPYALLLVDVGLDAGLAIGDKASVPHGERSQGKENSDAHERREGDVVPPGKISGVLG